MREWLASQPSRRRGSRPGGPTTLIASSGTGERLRLLRSGANHSSVRSGRPFGGNVSERAGSAEPSTLYLNLRFLERGRVVTLMSVSAPGTHRPRVALIRLYEIHRNFVKQLLTSASESAYGASAVAAIYAGKAAALREFQASLNGVLRKLAELRPPAVSNPDYRGQVHAIRGMSSTAGQLATALQAGPQGNVQQLLAQFDRAATSNQTISAQKARIAAIRAYDGQSTRLAKLSQEAELERLRLVNALS